VTTPAHSIDSLRTALGGRYSIERELGRGGMGTVYLARDLELDRPVALKVLPPEFALVSDLRERFVRETRTAASFSHPNIVPVFSIEDRDGLLAFAMGYVEGESLAQRVSRSGMLSVRELVRMLQDIGYALAYAHGRGVVHRDIKPDNIMLERATGRALLMDFGISRTIATPSTAQGLTRIGEVVGTPEFMSPEQAAGDTLSGRSDLYSLGLVAWFAATGALAITGDSTQKIIVRQITEVIPPIGAQRSDVPPALADAIDRCLRKDPDERFATAEALVDTLDAAQVAAPDVPLPIRVFSEEASTTGLMLIGGSIMSILLYYTLTRWFRWDLDVILPVVGFTAAVWARVPQTVQMARRLALRGFGVSEVQGGLLAVLDERDADRMQQRADARIVARRRTQLMILALVLVASFALEWYVVTFQRRLLQPGIYGVSRPGVLMLYAANVMRGLSIIGLIRSPLRRPLGEWLFRWFWLGSPGRLLLHAAARNVPERGSITRLRSTTRSQAVATPATGAVGSNGIGGRATAVSAVSETASIDARVQELERRVTTLENR
jgi:eukaryotic-like serine/threonine-protein kinase